MTDPCSGSSAVNVCIYICVPFTHDPHLRSSYIHCSLHLTLPTHQHAKTAQRNSLCHSQMILYHLDSTDTHTHTQNICSTPLCHFKTTGGKKEKKIAQAHIQCTLLFGVSIALVISIAIFPYLPSMADAVERSGTALSNRKSSLVANPTPSCRQRPIQLS